ncbi:MULTISPECIES: ribonuclease H-like YkuK family protein [Bacillus cereus group]|uniref:ribonuclease H-like YkuK family protein n=1 Tax=Bacillus cereus group TaxID=86661 RepID=UPI000ABC390A
MLFDERKKERLIQLILPYVYDGGSLSIEGHIDIGSSKRNRTGEYVVEMMNRVESMGLDPKIKPESFVASSYANRYTK